MTKNANAINKKITLSLCVLFGNLITGSGFFYFFKKHFAVTKTSETKQRSQKSYFRINCISSCELQLHLHAERFHPLQMSGGLSRPRANASITAYSTAWTLVAKCQKESRDARGIQRPAASRAVQKMSKEPIRWLVYCVLIYYIFNPV